MGSEVWIRDSVVALCGGRRGVEGSWLYAARGRGVQESWLYAARGGACKSRGSMLREAVAFKSPGTMLREAGRARVVALCGSGPGPAVIPLCSC